MRARLTKVKRIASEAELKAVKAAKKDVGHKMRKQYSSIAQKRVPKALWHLYGLPMRDCNRPESEQKIFKTN